MRTAAHWRSRRFPLAVGLAVALLLTPLAVLAQDAPSSSVFEPGVVSLPGIDETSPSVSQDGQTLLFARTDGWEDKVPFLAVREAHGWRVERATFADTVYNAALSPDGQTAFFQVRQPAGDSTVDRVYRSDRTGDGWTEPVELPTLAGRGAGYISVVPDGTLYLFASRPRPGIYRAEPAGDGRYGNPVWLGDAVSPEGATSFDALVHPDEDRLIISRYVDDSEREDLGESGFYLYRRAGDGWTEVRRLDLPYGWGATVLPDGRFLFVADGDLQTVPLAEIGVDW
ncbi:MAG: hypothetical protein AAGK21_01065 [Bacteroidota bacterium]